jgi:hypothetical protein
MAGMEYCHALSESKAFPRFVGKGFQCLGLLVQYPGASWLKNNVQKEYTNLDLNLKKIG